MSIFYSESDRIFHLFNEQISYIMTILPNGQLGQLYFGKKIHPQKDYSYLLEMVPRSMASYVFENERTLSLEHVRQEYGVYGSSDYRFPAVEILQKNGSRISDFRYKAHHIAAGKPALAGLPATYTEADSEAQTLTLVLEDPVTGVELKLYYTLFAQGGILARSAHFSNHGTEAVHLLKAMSLCMDLPDCDYDWIQFSGAWARERHPRVRHLEQGIQSVGSMRGHSSHEHNPFLILKRPAADEFQGEVFGFSLIYSGNFLAQAEVDTHSTTRVLLGINPEWFDWKLEPGESFQTPEAVMVYTNQGMNDLSQTFHRLYGRRLARGYWRDRERPILINNWEATYFDFTEEKILRLAETACKAGIELFVLDDGWFGKRLSDRAGLGDWRANPDRLPGGIDGLAEKIENLGMKFGLWFEPEMVNKDSDLYRAHPDWILSVPGRPQSQGRYQYVLDFSRPEVVDAVYQMMADILGSGKVSYVKWDMNRSITECWSAALPADRQGEVFHRYILGVYHLYEQLNTAFPQVLFESCASGGARFDPGLLYYAPQGWTSDDTDAIERLKIQYGTSYCYPVSSMGAHVSASPNHQVGRSTPLRTRANVACFGTFGYELDLNRLTSEELETVRRQTAFMKTWRSVLQFGTFYRLKSPFAGSTAAWMSVSQNQQTALVGWYRILNTPNPPYSRLKLAGLNPDFLYTVREGERILGEFYGDELMYAGLITTNGGSGEVLEGDGPGCDFDSRIYILERVQK